MTQAAEIPRIEPFSIAWNTVAESRWDAMYATCWRTTLPQSRAYALANAATRGERADFGVIRFHDKPVGLVTASLRRVMGVFAAASVYRGPVWLHETIPNHMLSLALAEVRRRFRLRHARSLLLHPELPDTPANHAALTRIGLRRVAPGYATAWLDLAHDEDALRRRLHGKWRNQLAKAEQSGLEVGAADADLDFVLERHDRDRLARAYTAPSGAWVRHLRRFLPVADFLALAARQDGQVIAGTVCARHGNTATYLVGWNGAAGRPVNAHNLLLWRSAVALRQAGCRWLDLGGVNDQSAAGVARFKTGMGGARVTLVGGYR